ncbi:MAG: Flp pilus assembly complex ATPase component TadA [Chloroflexi bacterium]|nr:Flp pilus assembly complex ATPase component TadA [Chloroflexota bacterium]
MIEKIGSDIPEDLNGDASNGSSAPDAQVPAERRPSFARPASLGQMVIDAGILSADEVASAQETAWKERLPLGRVLVKEGMVLSTDLATLTALHLGLAMVDLRSEKIDPASVALIPEDVARRYLGLPISRTKDRLTVAMTDPTDLQVLQDLASRTGYTIDPVITTEEDLQEHVDRAYRITAQPLSGVQSADIDLPEARLTAQTLRESGPAQVINLLLQQALQDRASDIHIEPSDSRLRIRFRIDGILHEVMNLPLDMHPTIISRLKIMCGMNIAERRRPQDGQLTFEVMDRSVDVRVAISGTVAGEMSVLRLLDDKKFTLLSLDQLGFRPDSEEAFRKLLRLPYGMVIVCGPTGSGKSTTLYASVLQMNRTENKVISIEDPVEYHMADVNQMQVNPEADITFASQLRSILRLDPDVILVGEIRDQETALIATQAALTGHLVLTTLHANDTVSALIRLKELGVPPYLVASSVAGIVAQRMVRAVCQTCMTLTDRPVAEQQAYAAEMGEEKQRFQYGSGCNACAQTGYVGRIGVFEVLNITDGIRQLFLEDAPRHQLFSKAVDEGIIVLRKDGMIKVQQNLTTPYEVMRVMFSLE